MRQDLIEASCKEGAFLKGRLNLSQDADPACAAPIDTRNNRRHNVAGSAVKVTSGASVGSAAAQ